MVWLLFIILTFTFYVLDLWNISYFMIMFMLCSSMHNMWLQTKITRKCLYVPTIFNTDDICAVPIIVLAWHVMLYTPPLVVFLIWRKFSAILYFLPFLGSLTPFISQITLIPISLLNIHFKRIGLPVMMETSVPTATSTSFAEYCANETAFFSGLIILSSKGSKRKIGINIKW